ncbi:MAG: spore germination protein [Lachnospiraceae bacterium]|nr:spore germination protein [Lachnospiraceae bacterium]
MQNISDNIEYNIGHLDARLDTDKNFDIIFKRFSVGDRKACIYCLNGFTRDEILQKILEYFARVEPGEVPADTDGFLKAMVPYADVTVVKTDDDMVTHLLMGMPSILVDGIDTCFSLDCRTYPARGVGEPEKEKVLRGSRDGFVETLVQNTALIRRRIRDENLRMEMYQVGSSSKTDVAICYYKGRVDKELLDRIRERIVSVEVDALVMNQESLAECIFPHKWYNPFPKFKYSERPDTTAAHLLEGNVIIMVDSSPSAMILPSSIFDIIEEADDYYFPPVTGTYLRLSRVIISIAAMYLTPVWLFFVQRPDLLPESFSFIIIHDDINIPIIWQLLILEFAIDGLKLAALDTPSMLNTPLSIIAGLVVGEFTVESGWFNSPSMLYMAFVALSNYTQPSFELSYALKFVRIMMLILVALFGGWGLIAGFIISILAIVTNKTIAGKSYIYPLIPFDLKEIKRRLFRTRIQHSIRHDRVKQS